jgi:hypothetical protein
MHVVVEVEPQPGTEQDGAAGQRQTQLFEREHQRQHQARTRRVADEGQPCGLGAAADDPLVGAQGVLEGGGERVLGGDSVLRYQGGGVRRERERTRQVAVCEGGAGDPTVGTPPRLASVLRQAVGEDGGRPA